MEHPGSKHVPVPTVGAGPGCAIGTLKFVCPGMAGVGRNLDLPGCLVLSLINAYVFRRPEDTGDLGYDLPSMLVRIHILSGTSLLEICATVSHPAIGSHGLSLF